MKKYKNLFIVVAVVIFMVPQVALAAWWNPLSWSVWNIFIPTPKVQQFQISTTTATTLTATTTKKAETNTKQDTAKDNKDSLIGSLKKQVADLTQKTNQPKVEAPKTSVVILPSGAVVEVDANGNVIRTIKEAPQQIYVPPVSATSQTQNRTTPPPVVTPVQTPQPSPTPAPSCTQDTWSCGDWNLCSASGSQTRNCTKTFDCSPTNTPSPSTSQSCTPPAPTQTTAPPSVPVVVYSDYNFSYQWNYRNNWTTTMVHGGRIDWSNTLSCPMTPRNIVIKKAVFEIPDSELQKINTFRALEADGFKIIMPPLPTLNAGQVTYNFEERSPNTFVYFGGDIPLCGNGAVVSINRLGGSFMDIADGRNVKVYLDQKGVTMEVNSIDNGVSFYLLAVPVMTEWEVWDYTTNRPVKIN